MRSARSKRSTHHETYELNLSDGRVLRTRVSRPPDRTTYGVQRWSHILRDQLDVTPQEFWRCIRDGVHPDRGEPSTPEHSIPTKVLFQLKHRVGLTDSQLAELTSDKVQLERHFIVS